MSLTEILYWVLMVILILLAWNHVSIDWSDIPLHLLNRNIPFCNFGWLPFPLCPSSTTYTHIYTYALPELNVWVHFVNVDGSLSCTNSNFMKGKEILRLCKDSKQTNMYKAKKIQKKTSKKKQTNKTKAFSVYPDIFIIQKHRYNYLFCATKSERVLLQISTKYMLYFLKI